MLTTLSAENSVEELSVPYIRTRLAAIEAELREMPVQPPEDWSVARSRAHTEQRTLRSTTAAALTTQLSLLEDWEAELSSTRHHVDFLETARETLAARLEQLPYRDTRQNEAQATGLRTSLQLIDTPTEALDIRSLPLFDLMCEAGLATPNPGDSVSWPAWWCLPLTRDLIQRCTRGVADARAQAESLLSSI